MSNVCVCACVRACVHACVRALARACVCACVRACVRARLSRCDPVPPARLAQRARTAVQGPYQPEPRCEKEPKPQRGCTEDKLEACRHILLDGGGVHEYHVAELEDNDG